MRSPSARDIRSDYPDPVGFLLFDEIRLRPDCMFHAGSDRSYADACNLSIVGLKLSQQSVLDLAERWAVLSFAVGHVGIESSLHNGQFTGAVASLGWGDTRDGNWGCSHFFPEKPGDLFSLFLLIAVTISLSLIRFALHSGVTPSSVSTTPFFTCLTSFLHYSL